MGLEGQRLNDKLAELRELQDDYRCRADLTIGGVPINEKTMTPLIAPSAVGKSTICNRILELAAEQGINAGEAGTETTRPWRPGDGENYRTAVSYDEMIEKIEDAVYPNWSITPVGHIYATPADSLSAEHNFLPCLPSSLPMLRRAGFKAINAFYIVTHQVAWENQIEERKGLKDFPGRIEEALVSLQFAWNDDNLQKIVSEPGEEKLTATAQTILDFASEATQHDKNTYDSVYQVQSFGRHSRAMFSRAVEYAEEYKRFA